MQTITVELLHDDALALLRQLEQLQILRLVTTEGQTPPPPSRRWAGSISKETASKMLRHIEQDRSQWERDT